MVRLRHRRSLREISTTSFTSLRLPPAVLTDQHQVTLDDVLLGKIGDVYDRDDLFELLTYLIERAIVAIDDNRHPGELRILSRPDRKTFDVVLARDANMPET